MRRILPPIEPGGGVSALDDGVDALGIERGAPIPPHLSMRRNTGPLSIFENSSQARKSLDRPTDGERSLAGFGRRSLRAESDQPELYPQALK
jgi:hypothetical protein